MALLVSYADVSCLADCAELQWEGGAINQKVLNQ